MPRIDPSKLASWYAAYASPLLLYARQFAGPLAEDIVHESFVQLLSQTKEPDNVKAWLYKTVRNAALTSLRSSSRRQNRERRASESQTGWFLPRPDDLIDASAAQTALDTLPHDQRETILLRIFAQCSFAEIADLTVTPLSTVYDRYKTGLSRLKQTLESSSCKTKTL
ncbi:MAG TPA: RNA polymerase sigma factor [Tepidisphaeraceae bacterium]|jgi:RNA polymerase sigma-70 factor (ECF subfamily)|nr:RNA polymerase sigma factor [Tepidisphaeraceae bacterium]